MNLFQKGEIILSSGIKSDFKIECDALTDADIECCAYLIRKRVTFNRVYGVPTGGLRLQKALEKYCHPMSENVLIVDDVITTGKSFETFVRGLKDVEMGTTIIGFVIFSRGEGISWVQSLFKMN